MLTCGHATAAGSSRSPTPPTSQSRPEPVRQAVSPTRLPAPLQLHLPLVRLLHCHLQRSPEIQPSPQPPSLPSLLRTSPASPPAPVQRHLPQLHLLHALRQRSLASQPHPQPQSLPSLAGLQVRPSMVAPHDSSATPRSLINPSRPQGSHPGSQQQLQHQWPCLHTLLMQQRPGPLRLLNMCLPSAKPQACMTHLA